MSCAYIQHNVSKPLVTVTKRLKKMFYHEAAALLQDVCDASSYATENVQKLFVGATVVVDKTSNLIIACTKLDMAASSGSFSLHSANHEV